MTASNGLACTNPIFIVGNVHSGTTLLRRIFEKIPFLYVVQGETQLYHHLPLYRRHFPNLNHDDILREYVTYLAKVIHTRFGRVTINSDKTEELEAFNLTSADVDAIFDCAKNVRDHLRLIDLVFDYVTVSMGKTRWVEKTPAHLFQIDKILRVLPDAKIIELVRDPRDILASKKARRSKEWLDKRAENSPNRKSEIFNVSAYDPVWDSLIWKSAINAGKEARKKHPGNVLRVCYEALATYPEKEVSRICDFVDIAYHPQLINVSWTNNTTKVVNVSSQGIGVSSIGKGLKMLPQEAVAVCQLITKNEMDELGYKRVLLSPSVVIKMPWVISKSGVAFVVRLYRRWRLGGATYLKNVVGINMLKRMQKLVSR